MQADSGSPKAFLPASAAIPLLSSVGASYKSDLKQTIIPCSAANSPNASTITVDFAFGVSNEGVIRVPIIQLIERYPDPNPPLIGNETACSFGVSPGPDGFMVSQVSYCLFPEIRHLYSIAIKPLLFWKWSTLSPLTWIL